MNTYSLSLSSASTQYAQHADATAYHITGDLTIECWVNFTSLGTGTNYGLIDKTYNSDYQFGLFLQGDGSGNKNLIFQAGSGASVDNHTSSNLTLSTETWYYLALVWSSAAHAASFYQGNTTTQPALINTDATGTITTLTNNTAPFTIGGRYGNQTVVTSPLDGLIDEVRLWSVARTIGQLQAGFNREIGAQTNLAAYYQLNNDYTDAAGNSNTVTGYNSPTFTANVPFLSSGGGALFFFP